MNKTQALIILAFGYLTVGYALIAFANFLHALVYGGMTFDSLDWLVWAGVSVVEMFAGAHFYEQARKEEKKSVTKIDSVGNATSK